MILITVGTQVPFDRLIEAVDIIAGKFPGNEFIAQALGGKYKPRHLKTLSFLEPKEFDSLFEKADLIIGHAGIGTVMTALTKNKPLIIMPRRAEFAEHRNNHQVTTANKLQQLGYVHVVQDEIELSNKLVEMFDSKSFKTLHTTGIWASLELITSLRNDINGFQH